MIIASNNEAGQIRQAARKGEVGEAVKLKIERSQISSHFQADDVAYVPGTGVQVCEAEQILLGQGTAGFLQSRTNGGVQARIGKEYFLRQGPGPQGRTETGPE